MGKIVHWVHKVNWTLVVAVSIASYGFSTGMKYLGLGMASIQPDQTTIISPETKIGVSSGNGATEKELSIIKILPDGKVERIK